MSNFFINLLKKLAASFAAGPKANKNSTMPKWHSVSALLGVRKYTIFRDTHQKYKE
jgi:hypothetical protein